MSKVIIIGGGDEAPKTKRIQFKQCLVESNSLEYANFQPCDFQYIELICKNYTLSAGDLMFAYDDPEAREDGFLFLGDFGDGIV